MGILIREKQEHEEIANIWDDIFIRIIVVIFHLV
jgi:hypothetical protein